ncbi:ras association domain-containing protein 8-like [Anneissia japonica]|uniref:ras association domain-containing protein 8-like n=1 Tax=Anneissia japonica TaxID=1529436 RepID=UPI00142555B5|nr:ras association domain-containing protein 8-like [Anneissia japonica]
MGELKVWVDGLQRIVSGINDKTTCQDVIIALAHFMRQTGRYTLVEKSSSHERPLEPHENPLRIMSRWSGGSNRFIMKRTGDVKNGAEKSAGKRKPFRLCEKHRSMENLTRPKETTVKRGNTFSGSWNSQVLSKKDIATSESKPSAIDLEKLWELVREQEQILEEQYEDMEDLDIDIEELLPYESDPPTIEDIEDQIIQYERTLKKNEARLEEEEFWEDELEMEEDEKNSLIEKLNKTKEEIIECEREIKNNKQEIKQLMKLLKAEKDLVDIKQLDDNNMKIEAEKRELHEELEAQDFESAEYEQELEELNEELKLLEVEFKRKIEEELKLQRDLEELEKQTPAEKSEEDQKTDDKTDDEPAIPIKPQKSSSNPIEFLRGGVLRRLKGSPRELSVSQDEPEGVFV